MGGACVTDFAVRLAGMADRRGEEPQVGFRALALSQVG